MAASLPILRALFKRQNPVPFGDDGETTATYGLSKPWRVDNSELSVSGINEPPVDAKALSALGIKTQKWGDKSYELQDYDQGVEVRPRETV